MTLQGIRIQGPGGDRAQPFVAALDLPEGDVDLDSTATAALMAMRDEERY